MNVAGEIGWIGFVLVAGGAAEPGRLRKILLRPALAEEVRGAQYFLSLRMTLFRGHGVPLDRLAEVLQHSAPLLERFAQKELRGGIAVFGELRELLRGSTIVAVLIGRLGA